MSDPDELLVDDARDAMRNSFRTGIYVRAKLGTQWGSFDIGTLTRESLIAWLGSRDEVGKGIAWRNAIILMLLSWGESE